MYGGALVLIAATAVAVTIAITAADGSGGEPAAAEPTTATALVEQRDVSARQQISGQLGFGGETTLIGQASGTVTALPPVGQVLNQGDVIYRVEGDAVVLLTGTTPVWRDFGWGATGPDAAQLNAALVALGYADGLGLDPSSDTVTWRTQQAVRRMQAALGLRETGVLAAGQTIFAPTPLRVTAITAMLGGPVGPGQAVLTGTDTEAQVTADVRVAIAHGIEQGDAVIVTLPDQSTTAGTVEDVGTVATQSGNDAATVPVTVSLDDPGAADGLDKAPVMVAITTATVEDALVVPVTALLARAGGDYAVELVDESGATLLVPVELGLFDSGGGVVQVIGDGLDAGQRVTVPSP